MMEEKVFFNGKLGKVCGILHKANDRKDIVIIVHGFSSNKDSSALPIARELNKIGINALRIDLDNRGESELDFQTGASVPNYVEQVEASIRYCKDAGFKEISLIGGSYGAMVVFAVTLVHPEIKKLVLRVPVVDYEEHALWAYGKEKLQEYKKQGFMPYYDKHNKRFDVTFDFIEKSYPYSMYKLANRVKMPTLIVEGDKDEEVDPLCAEKVVKCFPNAKLHMIKGAGHNLSVNGDFSEGLKTVVDFFK